jgi:hypothetical protein
MAMFGTFCRILLPDGWVPPGCTREPVRGQLLGTGTLVEDHVRRWAVVETVPAVGCGRPSPSDHNDSLGGPVVVIAILTQPPEEHANAVVDPIRLVRQRYIHTDDPDVNMRIGEIVHEALTRVTSERGPTPRLVVQIYSAELH